MIVFFGSSKYSIPALKRLLELKYRPIVVTTPDKPAGRHQTLTPNPLARFAAEQNLPLLKLEKLDLKSLKPLKKNKKEYLGICCVYGKIIPKEWLKFFSKGIINIHPSLLPKYRGASPAQSAIIAGEKQTGITFIKMDEKLDHGPIIYQEKEKILENDTAETLYQRLFKKAALLLPQIIDKYLKRKLAAKKQNHSQATFTRLLRKEDGYIKLSILKKALEGENLSVNQLPPIVSEVIPNQKILPPTIIDRLQKALSPWPSLYTKISITQRGKKQEKILKIIETSSRKEKLLIKKVQLEGKRPVNFNQFLLAYSW